MFYLSSKLYHVNAGMTNQYIFSFSLIREFDQFLILLELYKLRIQDDFTLDIVVKHCNDYPNRKTLLDKVDNQLVDSLKISYYEVENYLPTLLQQKLYIDQNYMDNQLINFKIFNDVFRVIFNKRQINRLYYDINAYYSNYIVLESLYQLTLRNTNENDYKSIVNINEKRDSLKQEHQNAEKTKTNIQLPKKVVTPSSTRLDDILLLCISPLVKSFLIHISTNYYVYVTEDHCYLDDNNTYNIPNIFSSTYIFNSNYLKSILMCLVNYSVENIKMRTQKILMQLKDEHDELKPLERMLLINLLFLYYLRFTHETHTEYLDNNIVRIFNDSHLQSRLLFNHTKNYFPDIDLKFNVVDIGVDDMKEAKLDQDIVDIGKKYKHLIPVSEKDFIQKIMKEVDDDSPIDDQLKLNRIDILNLIELKNNSISPNKRSLLNQNKLITEDSQDERQENNNDLFKYNFNQDYLTPAYRLFNEYVNDPNTFVVQLKTNKLKTDNVSKTIINLFEPIKTILYSKEVNIQNHFNTYDYYKILCNNLNDPLSFPYYVLLFIIFQIIIPHLYVNYNMVEFENVLM